MESDIQQTYWETLRKELLYLIERELSPISQKYNYSEVPLESKIKWKPLVLILGNYSSGKSTLINEFIGHAIQQTGQAPTDDCFTVITNNETPVSKEVKVNERDGRALLYDSNYPFASLKRYGDKFASHFRLKEVNAGALENLTIIDTPGMLDSITERDRGYDYQAVIGDLAQLADLILVLFDPHKAGTIKESYASLRYTLPEKTFEDRVIFVLNRIDECNSLEDLLRVYGTLCWNLSQMTGRKDIPRILLTYSPKKLASVPHEQQKHLELLANQRGELHRLISQAPKHRLDHLATFLEHHSARLAHLVEALVAYGVKRRNFFLKYTFIGLLLSTAISLILTTYVYFVEPFGKMSDQKIIALGIGMTAGFYALIQLFVYKFMSHFFHNKTLAHLDDLIENSTPLRMESWSSVKDQVAWLLQRPQKLSPVNKLRKEHAKLSEIHNKSSNEIRAAISQLVLAKSKETLTEIS